MLWSLWRVQLLWRAAGKLAARNRAYPRVATRCLDGMTFAFQTAVVTRFARGFFFCAKGVDLACGEWTPAFLQWLRRLHHKRCADRVVVVLPAGLFLGWIHPWRGCNGRTARLVTSTLLIQEGVVPAFFSFLVVAKHLEAHVFAQNKSYYRCFNIHRRHAESAQSQCRGVSDICAERPTHVPLQR